MPVKKLDFLIEAVRYAADGKIVLVRGYERRGATYSDHVLLDRVELVERLQKKQRVAVGARVEYMASTFDPKAEVRFDSARNVVTSTTADSQDKLDAPLF
jgi:hypothetical protein